jgi:hypothetical protein
MRILRPGEAADSWIEGSVVSCTFLGRHARYVVDAEGQAVVVSTTDWSERTALAPHTRVRLGWLSDDAQGLVDSHAEAAAPHAVGEAAARSRPPSSPTRACGGVE